MLQAQEGLANLPKKRLATQAELDLLESQVADSRAVEQESGRDLVEEAIRLLEDNDMGRDATNNAENEREWAELESFIAPWLERRVRRLTIAVEGARRSAELRNQLNGALQAGEGVPDALLRLLAKAAKAEPAAELPAT
jgi:hypothetical protein